MPHSFDSVPDVDQPLPNDATVLCRLSLAKGQHSHKLSTLIRGTNEIP
jgi:hypothetical protein